MPWYDPWYSELAKKKICRFLLQRYLGRFLEEKLNLEQLHVDFYNGTGTVKDISLDCQALNELCSDQGWCIEVTSGHIGSFTVNIPWSTLMTKDSFVQIDGLSITIRPLARRKEEDAGSVLESMWSSMSSSMQLAEDCLKKESPTLPTTQDADRGVDRFAQIIDNILNRIQAKFTNTEIRLEHILPSKCDEDEVQENENGDFNGIAMVIKIDNLEYQNEAADDSPEDASADPSGDAGQTSANQKTLLLSTYATHHILIDGITFYSEEFRISNKKSRSRHKDPMMQSEQFYSTVSDLPETDQDEAAAAAGGRPLNRTESTDEGDASDDEVLYEEQILSSDPVIVAKISNRQDIRIRVKQSENVAGAKVQMEFNIGGILSFMTPRQLHMFIAFFDAFFGDDSHKPVNSRQKNSDRNMWDRQQSGGTTEKGDQYQGGGLLNQEGWSSDHNYKSSNTVSDFQQYLSATSQQLQSDQFFPVNRNLNESVGSSSMTSSMTSSITSSLNSAKTTRRRPLDTIDSNAEIYTLNIRIGSAALVILHEDVLVESSPAAKTAICETSVAKLQGLSEKFFNEMSAANYSTLIDFVETKRLLDKACSKNRMRILLAPVILEGGEHRYDNRGTVFKLNLSAARAEVTEILQDSCSPLLKFNPSSGSGVSRPSRPEIQMNIKQTTYPSRHNGRKTIPPKTDISITLEPSLIEFDLSIIDRIGGLINPSPFTEVWLDEDEATGAGNGNSNSQFTFKVNCTALSVHLRFPIPDLRKIHDPSRVPWWTRNVRTDFIAAELTQARFEYQPNNQRYEIAADEMNFDYYENDTAPRDRLAKALMFENEKTHVFEYPTIAIEISPDGCTESFLQPEKDSRRTPFTAKRVCRESDTPHSKDATKSSDAGDDNESEQLIIPGDAAEMSAFRESAKLSSQLKIFVNLPVASAQLKSKHLYEVIYNRLNSDLLMWEPSAPKKERKPRTFRAKKSPKPRIDPQAAMLASCGMMESVYVPCSSAIHLEPSSASSSASYSSNGGATSSENSSDSENIIQFSKSSGGNSANKRKNRKRAREAAAAKKDKTPSSIFHLQVGSGCISMYAPVRDAQNHVIPGQLGEFVIKVQRGSVFSSACYSGNPGLNYVCIEVDSVELHHCGLIPTPTNNPILRLINCQLPAHLQVTLKPTTTNLIPVPAKKSVKGQPMLSIAIQMKTVDRLKRIRVALAGRMITLLYNPVVQQHIWLTQLIDMFDVCDYPVLGYTPRDVVTEMHLHLWDCAIDYRPKYLGYRAVASLGTFMISSNIAAGSTGCTLRFIAEDCTLGIAPQVVDCTVAERPDVHVVAPASPKLSKETTDCADLVCVLEVGLFEISVRMSELVTALSPKFDLRASLNAVKLRTCVDSARGLAQLIAYIASEGDLTDETTDDESILDGSDSGAEGGHSSKLLDVHKDLKPPSVSESQQERVNQLMAEAMKESLRIPGNSFSYPLDRESDSDTECGGIDRGVDVFFFPDEEQKKQPRPFGADNDSKSLNFMETLTYEEGELKELMDFESSMMMSTQVRDDLGDVSVQRNVTENNPKTKRPPKRPIQRSSDTDDEFCIIAEEEKPFFNEDPANIELISDPIRIVDNHFSIPSGKPDLLRAPADFPMAVERYTLCEMSLTWDLFGGNDFAIVHDSDKNETPSKHKKETSSSPEITSRKTEKMSDAYKMGVSYSKGSTHVGFGTDSVKRKKSWNEAGGVARKYDTAMSIQLNKVRFSHELYPTHTEQASRQVLLVTELEICDRLQVSDINKFLYHPQMGATHNTNQQHMIVVKALHLRPAASNGGSAPALSMQQECCLRVSVLPLRLNIDQDSLLFLIDFFTQFSSDGEAKSGLPDDGGVGQKTAVVHQHPVMMVDDTLEVTQELQARKMVSKNLSLLMDDMGDKQSTKEDSASVDNSDVYPSSEQSSGPIFFRNVVFGPEVPIRLDYHGKRFELSHGPVAGLLMGLGQLHCSEIRLKKINHRHGILGFDRLINFLLHEWLQDIKKNQLHSIVGGVGPMYSLVQLFQGIRDLFLLPFEQYQKDGRIVRGLQLGAQSFTARTAFAALEITTRLIHLLQLTAETAYDMVSPGPSVRKQRRDANKRSKRKALHPPQDIREGVANAYQIVRDGLGDTAQTIVEVAAAEHDQKGYTGAVGAVVRQIPPTMVRPLILATQATTNLLGGVKNQLIPDARIEAREKWKASDE